MCVICSHRLAVADLFSALIAVVALVLRRANAERNEAAAERAAHQTENHAQKPSQQAVVVLHMGHAFGLAVWADNSHWEFGPATDRVECTLLESHWLLELGLLLVHRLLLLVHRLLLASHHGRVHVVLHLFLFPLYN